MDSQEAKLIARIADNLSEIESDIMEGWIDNPKTLQRVLREALCPQKIFPTWAQIKFGGHDSIGALIKDLELEKIRVSSTVCDMACNFATSPEREIELVAPTVRELGFNEPARFKEVAQRAREFGLKLAPKEATFYVALQMGDRADRDEILIFVTDNVNGLGDGCAVFGFARDQRSKFLVSARIDDPEIRVEPLRRVAFCL
ncbi:MAG: hypothetical protein ACQEP6_01280 [Patescibacteria group bacterium]